jgi:hypothetical protein
MKTHYIQESASLTTKAKIIFGKELVEKAFFSEYVNRNDNRYEEHTRKSFATFEEIERKEIEKELYDEISTDDRTITVMFTSGHCVDFQSSEWGSLYVSSQNRFEDSDHVRVYFD